MLSLDSRNVFLRHHVQEERYNNGLDWMLRKHVLKHKRDMILIHAIDTFHGKKLRQKMLKYIAIRKSRKSPFQSFNKFNRMNILQECARVMNCNIVIPLFCISNLNFRLVSHMFFIESNLMNNL